MSFYSEVGKRICRLRKMQGMTREELAERAKVTSKFLYEVEAGRKGLSAVTLYDISQALSVKCDYILSGEEEGSQNIDLQETLELFEAQDAAYLNDMLKQLYKFIKRREN